MQASLRHHDVDQAGVVFKVEEGRPLCRLRSLAMRHHSSNMDHRARFCIPQLHRRQHANRIQFLANKLCGMTIGRHAGGPQIRNSFFHRSHPWQPRRSTTGDDAFQPTRPRLDRGTDRPYRFAAVERKALGEHAGGGQRFELREMQVLMLISYSL